MPVNKTCFVIAPIGEPDSPTRKRSDKVLRHIITPAAEECGFTTLRADEIPQPGIITSQVIQHIIEDAMVVADLTGRNANVFYELAIRHAIRRPYVQIIDEGEPLPFDVANVRSISFTLDVESATIAKAEIVKQMRSMMSSDTHIESPITAAVDLNTLRTSEKPGDRQFAEVLTAIAELKQQVGSLQRQVAIPASLAASSPYTGYFSAASEAGQDLANNFLANNFARKAASGPYTEELANALLRTPVGAARVLIDPLHVASGSIQPVKPT